MKKSKTFLVCAMLSGSVLFSSCIGSFGLWNSLKDWNQGVSNKFVNELIFLAFHIVPVYEIAYLAGQSFELVKMNEDGTAVLSLQNGTSMTVTPDAQGIATARIATGNSLFFAAR